MSRILLLGRDGQVGWELNRLLAPLGELTAPGRTQLDLTDLAALTGLVRGIQPDWIVNAAAYTDIDQAEAEPDLARQINARAPGALAAEANRLGACLLHFSTDYVFDGSQDKPYVEADAPNPLNAYGRTKLEGERAISQAGGRYFILRTSWVYSLRRQSFVTKVLAWADHQETLRIVDDQWGSPTWCRTLAEASVHLLRSGDEQGGDWRRAQAGLYHVACRGVASRFEWARAVLDLAGPKSRPEVSPAASAEFPAAAIRPRYSALDSSRFESTFDFRLPDWRQALEAALLIRTT